MSEKKYKIKCPDCGYSEEIPKEWKIFNVVVCPICFRNINLPWCIKGFESNPRDSMMIIKKENGLKNNDGME